jgi:hypothetical protein
MFPTDAVSQVCERIAYLCYSIADDITVLSFVAWLFELAGGAIEDGAETTPVPLSSRQARFNLLALHQWPLNEDQIGDERCIKTAADWINKVIAPGSPGGPLPCVSLASPLPSSPFPILTIFISSFCGATVHQREHTRIKRGQDVWPRELGQARADQAAVGPA